MGQKPAPVLRCSFCQKTASDVKKLISGVQQDPRPYICNECIAVCAAVLEDDVNSAEQDAGRVTWGASSPQPKSPLRYHTPETLAPLIDQLLRLIELWITRESSGADASADLAHLRNLARLIFVNTDDR